MQEIIEIFRHNNFFKKNKPNISVIESIPLAKFVDTMKEVDELISLSHHPANNSLNSHAAEPNLGGSDLECRELSCRLNRIDSLSRYALLYSDNVYIESYFAKYTDLQGKVDYEKVKDDFYNDLVVFNHIIPLIEKGFIKLFSPNRQICYSCQAKKILSKNAWVRFEKLNNKLSSYILNDISIICRKSDGEYFYNILGIEKYFEHGLTFFHERAESALFKHKRILDKINKGVSVKLSKTLSKELTFHEEIAHMFIYNTIFGLSTSSVLNTSFLTSSRQQINFINSLNPSHITNNNNISEKYLSSIVPFVADVSIKNLIKLRKRENEAFLNYRSALNEAIYHYRNLKGVLTQSEAKEFYYDILEPKLANLDIKVKRAKRDLINKPLRSLVGFAGVISFGLLSGLLPENMTNIARLVGLTKFGTDLIKDTISIDDKENKIVDDRYYFLWRVKKLIKS